MSTAGRSQRTGRESRAAPWLALPAGVGVGACAQILDPSSSSCNVTLDYKPISTCQNGRRTWPLTRP